MSRFVFVMAILLALPSGLSWGDEPLKPEQLKKAYDDTLVQLKAAQDRKAQLAKENEALAAKVEELKKEVATSQSQADDLKRELSENEAKTFCLRSYQATWQGFLRQYPEVMARWKLYFNEGRGTMPPGIADCIGVD